MNEKLENKRKRGRPIEYPRIVNLELRKTYHTYTEAAEDINGSRYLPYAEELIILGGI